MKLENKKENHDITINFDDLFFNKDDVLLDPVVIQNGLLKVLKKNRIIRYVCGSTNYGYTALPIVKLNMGILKQYDYNGVIKYINSRSLSE